MEHGEQQPVVAISGLTKRYGDHLAVDDVSLWVNRGEIFGILGTNGAGKTTSVECAQGLRRPDRGQVRVLGCDPFSERSALRGRVGSQLQDASLPERLRVEEAIRLFAENKRLAAQAMHDWNLNDIARTPFDGLSGGQRQRLFLALALMNNPEVVFLDELTQGLDPDARQTVWRLIERIRDQGTTVVLVTHFMDEAEALCDRVAVMNRGRVVTVGSPTELIDRYGDGVHVTIPGGPDTATLLGQLPGVTSVKVHGDEVVVACRNSGEIAHVGAALVAHGRAPSRMQVHQPGLEEALLNLVETQPTTASPPTAGRTRAARGSRS